MATEAEEIVRFDVSHDEGLDLNETGLIESDVEEEKEIAEIIAAADGGNVSEAESERSGMVLEVDTTSTKPIFQLSRRYENPSGDFVTGFDTTTKENFEKKQERAKRFGLKEKILPSLEDSALTELYASLGIHDVEKEKASERGMRCEAIHVRGVNDMSTEDVFNYFSQFAPGSIEWIDDRSCNVVWMDAVTAARAMLALSYDPVAKKEKKLEKEKVQKKSKIEERMKARLSQDGQTEEAEAMQESDDDLNLMSEGEVEDEEKKDVETGEVQAGKPKDDDKMETEAKQDDGKSEGECSTDEEEEAAPGEMPPGRWRVGNTPNAKHQLYLRFATKADKKLPGAERRSKYYQKYGNPNFGGIVGLISGSRKRRLKAEERRREEEEARAAVAAGGRTISPVVVEGDDPFDLHSSELVEEFGIAPKEKKLPVEIEEKLSKYKDQVGMDQDSDDEMGSPRKRRRPVSERLARPRGGSLSDEEGECSEDAAEFDEEALQMEAELQVLMEQTPDLVPEEVEDRSQREAMKMHADEEEEQIVLRQQRAKRLAAIQAIHELDNQLKHVKDGKMDARSKIKPKEPWMAQENVIPQKVIVDFDDEDMTPEVILKAPSPDRWTHADFIAEDVDADLLNANALSDEEIVDFRIEAKVKKPKKSRLDNRLGVKRGSPLLVTAMPTRQAASSRLGPKAERLMDDPLIQERRTIRHEEKRRAAIHRLGTRKEPPQVSARERRRGRGGEPMDNRRPVGGRVWQAPQRPMMKTHMDDESETRHRRTAGVDSRTGWGHDDRVPVSRDTWRGDNVAPPSGRYGGGGGSSKRGIKERSRSQREEERERRRQKEREAARKRQREARAREQEKLKRGVRRGNMVFVTDSEDSNVESATDEEAPPPTKPTKDSRRERREERSHQKLKIKVESDDDDDFDL